MGDAEEAAPKCLPSSDGEPRHPFDALHSNGLPLRFFPRPNHNPAFIPPLFLTDRAEYDKIAPPRQVKALEQRLSDLSEEERAAFEEFKVVTAEKGWYGQHGVDDWTLLRYLAARKFDVAKSTTMLEKSVAWLRDFKPANSRCLKCDTEPGAHMQAFCGWDLEHRPVMYASYKYATDRTNPTNSVQHNVEIFDTCMQNMPEGVTQWITCTDFVGYSHWSDGRSDVGKAVIDVMQNQYPERLGAFFLVDPPTTFWVLFKVLSMFVDEKTVAKVQFVYTDKKPCIDDVFPKAFPKHLSDYLIHHFKENKKKAAAKGTQPTTADEECA